MDNKSKRKKSDFNIYELMEKKVAKIDNPEWRKYYQVILWWMNEKFYDHNIGSGYAYPAIRQSFDGKEEYYAFFIETGQVTPEKGHKEWLEDFPEVAKYDFMFTKKKEVTLDDLQELNLKLKEAGAEKVYVQTDEMYVHGQAALYNYITPNTLLLLIK